MSFFMLFIIFIVGIALAHFADFLAEYWHIEKQDERATIIAGIKQQGLPSIIYRGRKRPARQTLLETSFLSLYLVAVFSMHGISEQSLIFSVLLFSGLVAYLSDIRWREIPHEINYFMFAIATLLVLLGDKTLGEFLFGIVPFIILLTIAVAMSFIHGGNSGLGGGDLRFVLATGVLGGFAFVSSLIGLGGLFAFVFGLTRKEYRENGIPMMIGFLPASICILFFCYYMELV